MTVTDSNNRLEDMEGTPTVTDIGAGAGGGQETVTYFQGAASISRKVTSSSARGTGTTAGTPADMTSGDNTVWLSKTLLTDYLDINSVGWFIRFGDSTANYYQYILLDDGTLGDRDKNDFPRGGWIVEAVNPNVVAWRDATGGTPTLTAVDVFQVGCGLNTGAAKSENLFIDSIDLGDGLYYTGSTGTWADFVAYDQGQLTNGRFGHFLTNASGIEVRGKAVRGRTASGTVTATTFADSLQSIAWPGGRVDVGWNELEDDLGNGSTTIEEISETFQGLGRDNTKKFFDTEFEVTGGATDTVTITSHGYKTGEYITYSNEGGSENMGLTSGNSYWIGAIDTDTLAFYSSRANSYTDTTRTNLTASSSGNGENHSITLGPDTRPDYTATSNSGSATYNSCNFVRFRVFTLTSGVSFTACQIVSADSVVLGGASIDNCTFNLGTTYPGDALASGSVTEIENVTDTAFVASSLGGHAIEISSGSTDLDIVGLLFSGYGPDPELGNGHSFDTENDVDGTNDEIDYTSHQFSTGDPVYYSHYDPTTGTAGTEAIGLTDAALYFVRSVTANSFSLHPTEYAATNNQNKINLTASGVGNGETHTFYSANAAIVNNTSGDITINVTGGGTVPSVRNVGAATSTVVSAVGLELNGLTEGSRGVFIGNGGAEDGNILMQGYADDTGTITGSFGGTTPQNVIVRARNAGIINAAIQDDGGVFTDYTDTARTLTGAPGTGSTDDVDLTAATPATSDAFYFAGRATFEEIEINITTAGSGYTGSWDYWNGSWTSLTVTDTTNSFQTSGYGLVDFTAPSNWTTTTINGQGPFYYVRFTVDSVTTPNQAQADSITLNKTVKYIPFEGSGIITGTGLTATAVWIEDDNND